MHMIDPRWTDLADGYEAVRLFQDKLQKEFGRSVKVGKERKYQKEFTEWQRKRRIFFSLVALAPLSILGLCVSAFYFRAVACVILYWVLVVAVILLALAVASRNYIQEAIHRPQKPEAGDIPLDLEQRWWASLTPQPPALQKKANKDPIDFLSRLGRLLGEEYLLTSSLPEPVGQEVFVVGPSGIWIFMISPWSGVVAKQAGTWREERRHWERGNYGKRTEMVFETGPDDRWLTQKKQVIQAVQEQWPELLGSQNGDTASQAGGVAVDLVGGGVVFSQPHIKLDKSRITGTTAAYGPSAAWVERVRQSRPREGLNRQICLKVLEMLSALARAEPSQGAGTASAKEEAAKLYADAVQELRAYLQQIVN